MFGVANMSFTRTLAAVCLAFAVVAVQEPAAQRSEAVDSSFTAGVTDVASLQKVQMFRAYDPEASEGDNEVPDPWFGGAEGFENVLRVVERTADALVEELSRRLR